MLGSSWNGIEVMFESEREQILRNVVERRRILKKAQLTYDKKRRQDMQQDSGAEKALLAWINKGYTFDELHRYEDAIECYDNALEISSNYKYAWMLKGLTLLLDLERYEEATQVVSVIF